MGTERQKKVATKITENYRSKKVLNKGEILKESNYSESTTKQPNRIIDGKGVQEELKPFIKKLEVERDRLINAISIKDISKVDYEKAINSLDKIVKNMQLLTGGDTERIGGNKELDKKIDKVLDNYIEDDKNGNN